MKFVDYGGYLPDGEVNLFTKDLVTNFLLNKFTYPICKNYFIAAP